MFQYPNFRGALVGSSAFRTDGRDVLEQQRTAVLQIFERGLQSFKRLHAHRSCVNAMKWSRGEGRWLASSGDDRRIFVWDVYSDQDKPIAGFGGPTGNVFTLDWSTSNKYIYSGGVDNTVFQYDATRVGDSQANRQSNPSALQPFIRSFDQHLGTIRDVSAHPTSDDILLSVAEDGQLIMHDSRSPSACGTITRRTEFTAVQYHPVKDHQFVSSDHTGFTCLHDARYAFASGPRRVGAVLEYVTTICKSWSRMANPEVSSVAFDKDGSKLAITFLGFRPTIYSTDDPFPVAVCNGKNLPSGQIIPPGERTYSNNCTIKHGSFGGPSLTSDVYYTAGSEDFRAYCWKIPPLDQLLGGRRAIGHETLWEERGFGGDDIGFTRVDSQTRIVPVELSTPAFRLAGHRSIVNTSLIHPVLPQIATSGVESVILLHGAFASGSDRETECNKEQETRHLPPGEEIEDRARIQSILNMIGNPIQITNVPENETLDDTSIAYFDEILREAANDREDIFESRRIDGRNEVAEDSSEEESFRDVSTSDDETGE